MPRITKLTHIAFGAVGFGVMATSALAATITIDSFATNSGPVSATDGMTAVEETAAPEALGGFRYIEVGGDAVSPDETVGAVNQGELTFSNDSGVQGTMDVTYDGFADTGLGGVDLTDGGMNDAFAFDLTTDVPISYSISVYDTFGASAMSPSTTSSAFVADQPILISFADFAGVDLSSVNSIILSLIDTTTDFAADVAIDDFASVDTTPQVPVPASALLLAGGLGAFGLMRKRRS